MNFILVTEGSLPGWEDTLTAKQMNILARYLQHELLQSPELGIAEIKKTWKVTVPVNKRPKRQMNSYNLKNIFSVLTG